MAIADSEVSEDPQLRRLARALRARPRNGLEGLAGSDAPLSAAQIRSALSRLNLPAQLVEALRTDGAGMTADEARVVAAAIVRTALSHLDSRLEGGLAPVLRGRDRGWSRTLGSVLAEKSRVTPTQAGACAHALRDALAALAQARDLSETIPACPRDLRALARWSDEQSCMAEFMESLLRESDSTRLRALDESYRRYTNELGTCLPSLLSALKPR